MNADVLWEFFRNDLCSTKDYRGKSSGVWEKLFIDTEYYGRGFDLFLNKIYLKTTEDLISF
jgi:hypothetical protein